jgi:hypothetical protein
MLIDRSTGNGVLNREVTPSGPGQLEEVRITLDAGSATSETLVVKILSASGSQYNTTLESQDMNTLSYHVFQPTRPHPFFAGDKISVTWTNTNSRIFGLEIMWRPTQ